ncbi:MAG: hypothetical protein IPH95_22315 [Candidatus Promineofilum sp.]|nr:hypothetical protein [Promineifilum sp.]
MTSNNQRNSSPWVAILVAIIGALRLIIAAMIPTLLRHNSPSQSTTPLLTENIPRTPEEAAELFNGPPSSDWAKCRDEFNCWMFEVPGSSFMISVPESCVDTDGSIDGWRRNGGYPGEPDSRQGTVRIWNDLEAATIRCK